MIRVNDSKNCVLMALFRGQSMDDKVQKSKKKVLMPTPAGFEPALPKEIDRILEILVYAGVSWNPECDRYGRLTNRLNHSAKVSC